MKIKTIFLSIAITVITRTVCAQTFEWGKSIGAASADISSSIALDTSGNVYTTGNFQGMVDFDPGVGIVNLTSAGDADIFISKWDASGNFMWAKSMGATGYDYAASIALDASGNVYITGYFHGIVDFDPGAGIFNLTSAGGSDIFISKLDASGNFMWAKNMGGTNFDYSYSIVLDASGNVYTTGNFLGIVDFDPGVGIVNLTSAGSADIFISKLDVSGNFVWAKNMGGTSFDNSSSIALDAEGNVYTTGNFRGTADFDPGANMFNLTSVGDGDIFISKLDASGNFIWAKNIGGTSYDYATSIALDALGNVYTTGNFKKTVDFDPGAGIINLTSAGDADIFISKLDASGNFIWVKNIGATDYDTGTSIDLDASGNVYTTGYFKETVDFNPGTGIFNFISEGDADIFISKLDASGNFMWAKNMGATGYDYASSIVLDASGNIYTTGHFEETVDFDPDAGVFNLTSEGGSDIFIQKLSRTTAGIIESNFGSKFMIYPNPSNGNFSVDLGETFNLVSMNITDLNGKLIQSHTFNNTQILNLTINSVAGLYLLSIETEENKAIIRLVKK